MKKLKLILLSIATGLLLGNYYSLVPGKLLLEYILAACLSFKLGKSLNNNADNLITAQEKFN